MCLNLVCFTWSNSYKALKSPISNVDFMVIVPHFDSTTDLKVYDLNFRIIFVVALCRKGVQPFKLAAKRRKVFDMSKFSPISCNFQVQ